MPSCGAVCTLILGFSASGPRALVVAANRDEDLDRPAEGPRARRFGQARVFAPLDVEAGGTWMGVSEHGVFAALTNRFGVPRHPERRSRGALVVEALSFPSAREAYTWASKLDPAHENGFHLVVADAEGAYLVAGDGSTLRTDALPPGVHVVTERALGAAPSARQDRLVAELGHLEADQLDLDRLAALLADRTGGPFDSVCVEVPERGYGTRSGAIVELYRDGRRATWLSADGPPCRAPFRPLEVELGG